LGYVHVSSRMSKSLVNLCMFCIAKNLESIDRIGSFLCKNDNELVLELLCDHDMLTGNRMPYITTELLTSRLENIAFCYSGQVDDILLQKVALSRCKLKSFILKVCPQVSGEFRLHVQVTSHFCETSSRRYILAALSQEFKLLFFIVLVPQWPSCEPF